MKMKEWRQNFKNHFKSLKSKLFKINNTRSAKTKHELCILELRLCKKTIQYAKEAKVKIEKTKYAKIFTKYLELAQTVYDIAYRRILKKECVPAKEKIVSIFEKHADIIAKGLRDVQFGHKSTITAEELWGSTRCEDS